MNKKGITLVEIIISIGLISLVMLFLFNLLIDMQYEEDHASFAKENQLNRAAIIKNVQEDFAESELKRIAEIQRDSDNTRIVFEFNKSSPKFLEIYSDHISYDGETWYIEAKNDTTVYDFQNITYQETPDTTTYRLNIDTNGDGDCDINCDKNQNGILDGEEELNTKNESYKIQSSYTYFHVVIPVITGERENTIDDIELFYIGKKNS